MSSNDPFVRPSPLRGPALRGNGNVVSKNCVGRMKNNEAMKSDVLWKNVFRTRRHREKHSPREPTVGGMMKRNLLALTVLLTLAIAAGCGNRSNPESASDTSVPVASTTPVSLNKADYPVFPERRLRR